MIQSYKKQMHLSIIKKSLKNYYFYLKQTENRLLELSYSSISLNEKDELDESILLDVTSELNDTRLEMRFIEKELGLEKHQFIDFSEDTPTLLEDDEEFDYTGPAFLKNCEKMIKKIEKQDLAEINTAKEIIKDNKNGVNDNFKSLISQPINDHFSWGKYGDFNIIIKNDNGYVNASYLIAEALKYEAVIRQNAGLKQVEKKALTYWRKNLETQALIVSTKIKTGLNEDGLIYDNNFKQKHGFGFLKGMFIHPLLVNSLATWVSPSYALEINEIINQLKIDEKTEADQKRIKVLTKGCKKKDSTIKKLTDMYNSISADNKILIENSRIIISKLDKANDKINETNATLKKTNEKLDEGVDILKSLKNNIKLDMKDKFCDIVLILQVFNNGILDCYKILRTTYENLNKTYYYHKNNNERVECILGKETVNGKQACKKFIDENKNNVIGNITTITLKPGYTEEMLINDFKKMLEAPNKKINKFISNK